MKYIEAEKLKAEIKIIQQSLESRDVRSNQVKKIRTECMIEFCKCIFEVIDSLQQEQPEIDLEKKIQDWCKENVTGVKPIYTADSLIYDLLPKTAHHFYELGKNSK